VYILYLSFYFPLLVRPWNNNQHPLYFICTVQSYHYIIMVTNRSR
jgi:hypothetical protein